MVNHMEREAKTYFDNYEVQQVYKNYPQLVNAHNFNDELAKIWEWHKSSQLDIDYGSCSAILTDKKVVYYFTQCPAKYFYSQIWHKYDIGLEITPIGNYEGKYNIFKAEYIEAFDWENNPRIIDLFGKQLGWYIEQHGRVSASDIESMLGENNNVLCPLVSECLQMVDELTNLLEHIGFDARPDCREFNCGLYNNKFVVFDPVFVYWD